MRRTQLIDKYTANTSQEHYLRKLILALPQEVQDEVARNDGWVCPERGITMGLMDALLETHETWHFVVACAPWSAHGRHERLNALVNEVKINATVDAYLSHCEYIAGAYGK